MRLHRSNRLQERWYSLPPEIRQFVESLKIDSEPKSARSLPERPGRYEDFIAGLWVIWEVDTTGSETIIRVTISE